MSGQVAALKMWPAAEGAWQVRLPLPWVLGSVNVFLFRSGSGFVLLDTGIRSEESLSLIEAALHSLGATWRGIKEILVSHLHPDHIGAAAEIRRLSGAPVRMPFGEMGLVRPLGPKRTFFAETADFLLAHGMPAGQVDLLRERAAAHSGASERLDVDAGISGGERVRFDGGWLEAVPAPGHSPSLLCFYCAEQRVLFSTDAILPKVTPNIGVTWFYPDDPLGDYFRTLGSLYTLNATSVAPSHGRPFQDHRPWIDNTRRHHARRCETILDAMGPEPIHAYELAGRVWGKDRSLFDRRLAISESLSHLHFMALQDRVESFSIDGVIHWMSTGKAAPAAEMAHANA